VCYWTAVFAKGRRNGSPLEGTPASNTLAGLPIIRAMHTFQLRTLLDACLLLLACSPETDLQKEHTVAAGAEGGDGQLSGSSGNPQSGQLVDPPSGAADIATNLASVVLRFPEAVMAAGAGPGALLQPAGSPNPMSLQLGAEIPCAAKCYAMSLAAELAAFTAYTVEVPANALQFLDGKPVQAGDAGSFTTGAATDLFAPRVEAFTLQVAEGCATVHVAADEQVRGQVALSSNGVETALVSASVGLTLDFSQRLPDLPADPHAQAVACIADRSGNQAMSAPLVFALPPPIPRVVITEVLANPVGSETTQEFVELYNASAAMVALGGWSVEDKAGKDILPDVALPPGAYALIVSDAYNPADGKDPAPAEGTLLVHVTGRIGSHGLSNSGEAIRLVNADGQVVSQYGGWVDASATAWSGKSTKRVSVDACDAVDAWSNTPSAPTPGW
jgi:hypothetical protein